MSRQAEPSGFLLSTLQLAGGHPAARGALSPGGRQVAGGAGQEDTPHKPGGLGCVSASAALSPSKGEGAGSPSITPGTKGPGGSMPSSPVGTSPTPHPASAFPRLGEHTETRQSPPKSLETRGVWHTPSARCPLSCGGRGPGTCGASRWVFLGVLLPRAGRGCGCPKVPNPATLMSRFSSPVLGFLPVASGPSCSVQGLGALSCAGGSELGALC